MKTFLALACAGALLCGCTNSIRLTAAQGMYAAEAGAHGLNLSAVALAPSLSPAQRLKRKGQLDTINRTVSTAHEAYVVGNKALAASSAKSALVSIADVQKETPQ